MENKLNNIVNNEVYWYKKFLSKNNFFILALILVLILGWRLIIGGQKETQLPIPEFLNGAQIIFDKQMYYQIGDQQQETKTFKEINREIVTDTDMNTYYPNRFKFEPVSTSTKFSVIGALNNANYGLSAIDSGTTGVDYLILQDEQGNKSLIPTFYFYYDPEGMGSQDPMNASYYKNGVRIDYIRRSDFKLN